MFNNKNKNLNKIFKTADAYAESLEVNSKIILDKGTITYYLINIVDYAGGTTVLLDNEGNPMLSQVRL
ncbi:DUF6440 family protein [Clostridium estertheticum]|uniref:DUF6440 family protein n=1 Tax=Clostridium estertheticum TaxID=238834 RepID=UPI0013E92215|nr:DUF6440 family protein [Clostridium estertheticum]MBZ9687850.1 DUF6440 family protein [Clostridium estertheticum]